MMNRFTSVESAPGFMRMLAPLLAAGYLMVGAPLAPGAPPLIEATRTTVFQSGVDGYHTYRIPAMVKAANGELLAFAEGRKNNRNDAGDIDIVMKRSRDGGATWGEMTLVQDEWDRPDDEVTLGNPTPVVDRLDPEHPGRIWLAFTRNNDRVFVAHSDDHGASWSQRREITSTAKLPQWSWYATGPVHGIQLTRGKHAGRLIIPSDHRLADQDSWGAHVLLSDDHGRSWTIGGVDTQLAADPIHPNENAAVELVDGRVYFNARNQRGSHPAKRAVAFSADGGTSYTAPFAAAPDIVSPIVQNSLLRVFAEDEGDPGNLIMWSGPSDPRARQDLTILVSTDEAQTWKVQGLLHEGPAAYSDLVKIDDKRVGALYEAGEPLYSEILFAAFSLE